MTTAHNLETLADALEAIVADHKARVARIDGRRQRLVVQENRLAQSFADARRALDELETAITNQFDDWSALENAELAEAQGDPGGEAEEPAEEPRQRGNGAFSSIMGGKGGGNSQH